MARRDGKLSAPHGTPRARRTMSSTSRPAILSYGLGVVSVLVAALLRLALNPLLQDRVPFATFFLAIFVTIWYGGLRPSLLCLSPGTVAATFLVRAVGEP